MKQAKILLLLILTGLFLNSCRLNEGEFSLLVASNDIRTLKRQHLFRKRFRTYRIHQEAYAYLFSRDDQSSLQWLLEETEYFEANPKQLDLLLENAIQSDNEIIFDLALSQAFSREYQETRSQPLLFLVLDTGNQDLLPVLQNHGYHLINEKPVLLHLTEKQDTGTLAKILDYGFLEAEQLGKAENLIPALEAGFDDYIRLMIDYGVESHRQYQAQQDPLILQSVHLGSILWQYRPDLVEEFGLDEDVKTDRHNSSLFPANYRISGESPYYFPSGQLSFLKGKQLILTEEEMILAVNDTEGILAIHQSPFQRMDTEETIPDRQNSLHRIQTEMPLPSPYGSLRLELYPVGPVRGMLSPEEKETLSESCLILEKLSAETENRIYRESPLPPDCLIPLERLELPDVKNVWLRIRINTGDRPEYNLSLYTETEDGYIHLENFETGNSNYVFRPINGTVLSREMRDRDDDLTVSIHIFYNGQEVEGWYEVSQNEAFTSDAFSEKPVIPETPPE